MSISDALAPSTLPATADRASAAELELARRQLRGIDAFHTARARAQAALESVARTRELQMDSARRLEVLRREHDALIGRAHEQLRASSELPGGAAPRAVVAHRSGWFADKLVALLQQARLEVVEQVDNGADAIGIVVVEQPDLLFVEDGLLMVSGEEVVREAHRFCPQTRIGAQVEHVGRVEALLEAGADAVATRQSPPAEVSEQLLSLVRG